MAEMALRLRIRDPRWRARPRLSHHENELAQSRGAGRDFAKIWMHNGMLRFVGEKMSKSLGNVVTLRDDARRVGPRDVARVLPHGSLGEPSRLLRRDPDCGSASSRRFQNAFLGWEGEPARMPPEAFAVALDDDFNTPSALALMHRWLDERRLDLVYPCLEPFGLEALATTPEAPEEVLDVARRRQEARDNGDFATSDRLRDEIAALGWEVRGRGGWLPARAAMSADLVYGRRADRGSVARAALGDRTSMRGDRALAAEEWLRDVSGLRVHVEPERRSPSLRDVGSPRRRGSVRAVDMPTRTSLRPGRTR